MMNTGHVPDQDLLLLTHHALSPWRRVCTDIHLRRCAQCRRRSVQLAHVSQTLAVTIRDPSSLPWHPPVPAAPGIFWRTLTLALLSLLLTIGLAVWTVNHRIQRQATPSVGGSSSGCRPDLPNDRCR